jgi:TPR repeat protein
MENLGDMYRQGQGVPQDYVQAHKWYNLAATIYTNTEVHRDAAKARDSLAKRMTPAQIAEAQRLAREWKPSSH